MTATATNAVEAQVLRYYRLVDDGDVDGLVALFATSCEYHRPGYPVLRGHGELARFYRRDRVIASGGHVVEAIVTEHRRAVVLGSFSGTLRDGSPASVDFCDHFEMDAELLIRRRTTYFFAPAV